MWTKSEKHPHIFSSIKALTGVIYVIYALRCSPLGNITMILLGENTFTRQLEIHLQSMRVMDVYFPFTVILSMTFSLLAALNAAFKPDAVISVSVDTPHAVSFGRPVISYNNST